ncbi:unnamed protein product [Candidula unifasciata]|uniref:OPA3-like protein n=1 Tax=Candidula unifasciata TaxID=100452 RepID=A0A8S3ZMN1_9EUPU|nr:unnamed protein product [Candidula unifasciata]
MAPFPLIKLGYLAVKQISKPIANCIKKKCKNQHNFFRKKNICMPPAQFYHYEVNVRLRILSLGQAQTVDKLSQKEATELGSEMLGESVIFLMAVLVLTLEYARAARKEAANEDKIKQEKKQFLCKIRDLETVTEIQAAQIRELQHRLNLLYTTKHESQSSVLGLAQKLIGQTDKTGTSR